MQRKKKMGEGDFSVIKKALHPVNDSSTYRDQRQRAIHTHTFTPIHMIKSACFWTVRGENWHKHR